MSKKREPEPAPKVAVTNLATAHFDCVYPTCGGICCMNGRPAIEPREEALIRANQAKFLPHLRPEARALMQKRGFLSDQEKEGRPTLRTSKGWCIFFKDGCVLHQVGAEEGDRFKYKPWRCVLFPLTREKKSGDWHVRQHGLHGEAWDLFCLNPAESPKLAQETMTGEVAALEKLVAERKLPPLQGRKPDRARGES